MEKDLSICFFVTVSKLVKKGYKRKSGKIFAILPEI